MPAKPTLKATRVSRQTRLTAVIVASALFMQNLDSTVIATALPTMARSFGYDPVRMNVALTSYLLSLTVFIPASGWVADRYGTRNVFRWAIVVFTVGSILCGLSNGLVELVAARVLQGIGGAMMVPVGRLVLMRAVPKRNYVAALNYLTIPALLGPVTGPALGGAITLYFHWRWIFLINVPISILGLFLVLRHIPNVREPDMPAFDLRGFALSSVGLSVLMLGFSALGGHLLPVTAAGACIVIGTMTLMAYGWHARRTQHPVVDLRLLKLPTFRNGVLVGGVFRAGLGATPFLLPLLFQIGFGLNPLQSGILTCATAVGAMFMKTITVFILRRFGFRTVLSINGVAASAIIVAFGLFTATTPHVVIAAVLLVSGCLRSLQFTALNAISFADIAPQNMSQAASVSSMAQRLSQSVGIAAGAYFLQLSSVVQNHATIVTADFWPAFLGIGLISVAAPLLHLRLPPEAGIEVSGHARA
jgi:EmrB/QacA subfamily drug resistance transporter